ncbi:MAG: hypothetical protein ACM31L_16485 [Actinomycetota bacterium]
MLRNKQQSRKDGLRFDGLAEGIAVPPPAISGAAAFGSDDLRIPVLVELIDSLDLVSFIRDPGYRRQLNEVLDALSDEEFDRFECLYTRRFTVN